MTVHDPLIPTHEDLFHEEVLLLLPERFAINCKVLNNPVKRIDALIWQEFPSCIRARWITSTCSRASGINRAARLTKAPGKPALPAASEPLNWPSPAATRRRYSACCSTASTPCATSLSTVARPRAVRSTASSCATARTCWASWCR